MDEGNVCAIHMLTWSSFKLLIELVDTGPEQSLLTNDPSHPSLPRLSSAVLAWLWLVAGKAKAVVLRSENMIGLMRCILVDRV